MQLPGHRSWYFGGLWLRKKGTALKAVHVTSVRRDIPIMGNIPAKQTAASGYTGRRTSAFQEPPSHEKALGLLVPLLLMVKTEAGVDIFCLSLHWQPLSSPVDGLQDGVQKGKALPTVMEDQVRDHLRNLNIWDLTRCIPES